MDFLRAGIEKKLISFDENNKYINYTNQKIRKNFDNPEGKVQADTFLRLVLQYGYPEKRIRQFVPVQMGSETKEADIIIYSDDEHKSPFIVVECKKAEVTEQEFQRAVEQGFSYAVPEGARYTWITSGLKNEYFEVTKEKPKARVSIPDIPQFGVKELPKYKYVKGGGLSKAGQKFFELEIVSEDDLTRRFQQAHQALWGGGELNPSEAFDELDKLIFCKIWDERNRKRGEPYHFQVIPEKPADDSDAAKQKAVEATNSNLLSRLRELYEEGRKKDPEVFRDDIRLNVLKARAVVGYLEGINLTATDLDSKGRAFETFMGSFFRGDFGQYFTPRPIVKFIVDVLPITHESKVLDTSCGSGGFLLHALDKVRTQASDYHNSKTEAAQHFKHWHDFAQHNLFGIEINEQIARTAKMNMIIHDDGHTNVISSDGLIHPNDIQKKTGNKGFALEAFDFIITNPPFGSVVKQTEKAYLHQYNLGNKTTDWLNPKSFASPRPNQDTEILFMEQAHRFLCVGGYLAIVIPDGILTNSSLQYVRDCLEELYRIVAVISMPQTAFAANGAGVKSSVLFLRKYTTDETRAIQKAKQSLKDSLLKQYDFEKKLESFEKVKKVAGRNLENLPEYRDFSAKERKENPNYQAQVKSINENYSKQVEELKDKLTGAFQEKRKTISPDYDIFMAIAEDIGYDATGRPTKVNELDEISVLLREFIGAIEASRK